MSDPLMTIAVDKDDLIAAITTLIAKTGRSMSVYTKAAAQITARNIASEAEARVRRRTGRTAEGITVQETTNGDGYVVFVHEPENPGLPGWLEFGTIHMTAHPFLFASAQLEEGAHERRMAEAVQDAIDNLGMGD